MATHDNNMLDQDSQSQPWWWSPDGWLSATAPTDPAPQRDFVAGGSALHEVLQTTHSPTQQQLYEHSARHHLTSSTAMTSGLQPHGYQSTHNQPPHMSRKPMVQPNAGGHWVWVPDCLPPKVSNHHPANLPGMPSSPIHPPQKLNIVTSDATGDCRCNYTFEARTQLTEHCREYILDPALDPTTHHYRASSTQETPTPVRMPVSWVWAALRSGLGYETTSCYRASAAR